MLLVIGLQSIIRAPIRIFWAVAKIAAKNPTWTLSLAAAIGILSILVIYLIGALLIQQNGFYSELHRSIH